MVSMVKETNPVGQTHNLLNNDVKAIASEWETENPPVAWWKSRATITEAVSFLVDALDQLIVKVEKFAALSGPDKKATVLAAISTLYDNTIKGALPLWAKPFNSMIKNFILNVIISFTIDWVVEKYNNGSWRDDDGKTNQEGEVLSS